MAPSSGSPLPVVELVALGFAARVVGSKPVVLGNLGKRSAGEKAGPVTPLAAEKIGIVEAARRVLVQEFLVAGWRAASFERVALTTFAKPGRLDLVPHLIATVVFEWVARVQAVEVEGAKKEPQWVGGLESDELNLNLFF